MKELNKQIIKQYRFLVSLLTDKDFMDNQMQKPLMLKEMKGKVTCA